MVESNQNYLYHHAIIHLFVGTNYQGIVIVRLEVIISDIPVDVPHIIVVNRINFNPILNV